MGPSQRRTVGTGYRAARRDHPAGRRLERHVDLRMGGAAGGTTGLLYYRSRELISVPTLVVAEAHPRAVWPQRWRWCHRLDADEFPTVLAERVQFVLAKRLFIGSAADDVVLPSLLLVNEDGRWRNMRLLRSLRAPVVRQGSGARHGVARTEPCCASWSRARKARPKPERLKLLGEASARNQSEGLDSNPPADHIGVEDCYGRGAFGREFFEDNTVAPAWPSPSKGVIGPPPSPKQTSSSFGSANHTTTFFSSLRT